MPVNRNALIRYKTIDKCLQNRFKRWTLNDLIEACSEALYEYEGIDKGVSRRTVQADIQMMRSDKLGYNAPITVVENKYYTYEDPEYSITNIPLSGQDLSQLSEAVEFMKQFQGFSHFRQLDGMVQKLEAHIYSQKTATQSVIDFDKNEDLKGLEFLDPLYRAIIHKKAIRLTYQSFKARSPLSFDFHPYLLKEFRNRWFIIGSRRKKEGILNLALDRIVKLEHSDKEYAVTEDFDPQTYFKQAIGVSVSPNLQADKVQLFINHRHAPYVLTKPLHPSQKVMTTDHFGVTVSLDVQLNFELEKEILALGENVKVLAPPRLKRKIQNRIAEMKDNYEGELSASKMKTVKKQLTHKGFGIYNALYSQRDIRKMRSLLDRVLVQGRQDVHAQRQLLQKVPALKELLFNANFKSLVEEILPGAFLTKAIYFDKPPQSNWFVSWHQDIAINVKEKHETEGFYGWTSKDGVVSVCPPEQLLKNNFTIRIHLNDTDEKNGAVKVIPGSHNKVLNDEERKLITSNNLPYACIVLEGGIHLMKPLLLHASGKSISQKRRRVIHLEFSAEELPNGLEWAEKELIG